MMESNFSKMMISKIFNKTIRIRQFKHSHQQKNLTSKMFKENLLLNYFSNLQKNKKVKTRSPSSNLNNNLNIKLLIMNQINHQTTMIIKKDIFMKNKAILLFLEICSQGIKYSVEIVLDQPLMLHKTPYSIHQPNSI